MPIITVWWRSRSQRFSSVTCWSVSKEPPPLPTMLSRMQRQIRLATKYRRPSDQLTQALQWLASNTPVGATAIVPPWRKDSYYVSQRAQIASLGAVRYDRIEEWRERVELLVGPLSDSDPAAENESRLEARYRGLSEAQISSIVERYGGEYLVSPSEYAYPLLFDTGTYRVYRLASGVRVSVQHPAEPPAQ